MAVLVVLEIFPALFDGEIAGEELPGLGQFPDLTAGRRRVRTRFGGEEFHIRRVLADRADRIEVELLLGVDELEIQKIQPLRTPVRGALLFRERQRELQLLPGCQFPAVAPADGLERELAAVAQILPERLLGPAAVIPDEVGFACPFT